MKNKNLRETHSSICRICHGGCGALVTVENGKVVKVKGDPTSPMNKGWMCIKGLKTPEIVNHPDRLLDPLKRRRGKAEKWDKIPWEVALGEITERLDAIRQESGPESIALGQGTGRHHYMHVVRFANALGTPNWYEPGLAQCFIPRITVSNLTYGDFVTADYYGETPPRCILFWGHNPLVSSPDGELAIAAKRALDRGAIGIAVDPRRSETAKKCRLWLPIRPGTDAALALTMIHVIIYERLYHEGFVKEWTHGFDELKNHVQPCDLSWGAKVTGVDPDDIREAARLFATTSPAVLDWGVGIEQNVNCLQTVRSIACLRGLVGNIDIPGGDILGMHLARSYPTLSNSVPKGTIKKRLGADRFKLLGGWRAFMPSAHIPTLFNAMRTGEPYRVRALLLFGNNPLTTVANSRLVYEGMRKLDLLVATDHFMTPSAAMADYVLPAAYWPEVEQIIGYPLVADNLVYHQKAITQVGNCRQDEWIMDELAKRLHLPGSEESLEDVMKSQLTTLGVDLDELKQCGVVTKPHEYHKYGEKGFRTPSRKVELYSKALARLGYDPLPTYQEPPESPLSRPDLVADYPYVLTTGSRKKEFFHSEHRQIHSLRKRRPDPNAEIHPDLAARHGVSNGDWIVISSPRGSIRMRAEVTADIRSDVVNVEHGWWFPEKEGPDHGVWESNANILTNNAPPYDPAFGTYQLRGLLCRIEVERIPQENAKPHDRSN